MTGPLWWAPRAWVDGAWQCDVLLRVGSDGCWATVQPGVPAPDGARVLAGPVLPGLVDAHSHAFQRAFAGLAERRDGAHDDFWSWRDRKFGVALRITPDELRAVATQLYSELLCGGYTQICEFHYLHHREDGTRYADADADAGAMSRALVEAVDGAGIGLTLLPVLYERAGYTQPALRDDQRRFAADVTQVLALRDGVRALGAPRVSAGVAVHSLRAVPGGSLRDLVRRLGDDAGPVHIHIAEQTAEVDDCIAATGRRPIEWLAHEGLLDARWQLVHATHATPNEIDAVSHSGAGVVLCPTTEANLGDGIPDLPRWLASATPLSIGSDSHVGRDWPEELRWLEYTQRLVQRRRNVAAVPGAEPSTAARLFQAALAGGAAAAGWPKTGLHVGARADLLLLQPDGKAPGHALDRLIFAPRALPFLRTMVAGRWAASAPPP